MKIDKFLNRWVFAAFVVFLIAAVTAFWPGYFGHLFAPMDSHLHRHGLAMTLWCVLLIAQPVLISKKLYRLHGWMGYGSYLLVPVMAFTAFDLVNHLFHGATSLGMGHFYFVALSVNSIFAFLIIYSLAIYFRKVPALHARFMVSTVFPIITPVTDRLIYRFFRSIVPYAPKIGGSPIVPFYGFVLADVLLIGLAIWDWRSHKRLTAFPIALIIVLIYQFSVMNFYHYSFWRQFCYWFVGLPLD